MGQATPLFSPMVGTKETYNLVSGKNQREKDAKNAAIQAEKDRVEQEKNEAGQALKNEQATVDRPFATTEDTELLSTRKKRRLYGSNSLGIL